MGDPTRPRGLPQTWGGTFAACWDPGDGGQVWGGPACHLGGGNPPRYLGENKDFIGENKRVFCFSGASWCFFGLGRESGAAGSQGGGSAIQLPFYSAFSPSRGMNPPKKDPWDRGGRGFRGSSSPERSSTARGRCGACLLGGALCTQPEVSVGGAAKMAADTAASGFEHMGLDPRLLRAVAELGWATPTAIQAQAIPLALEGRDLLARARTGSGKTGAYGLPLLHKLLSIKEASPALPQAVRALVLVPSAELGRQVGQTLRHLSAFCARRLRVVDLCSQSDPAAQRPVLMEQPDVVVGTPGRVLAHLGGHSLSLRHSLELLVLDEADLLLSFGFGDDIKALLCHLPKIYQALLVSATFNPELEALQELVLHNPVLVLPPEPRLPGHSQLQQFQVRCGTEEDKFLVLVALLQLRLLRGRALLFVGSLARAFRLKLFLEQFGIPACTLNSELPAASRYARVLGGPRGCPWGRRGVPGVTGVSLGSQGCP
ncbi:probable ATP-dependent RNA helicase DDX56 isoform X2 [Manacus candei]|uniref:probable ATP-dependent RNA helicase DDX56 isoform X2 n=1 Tax=Manacus candei TaxID=415023 RepID=UPI0022265418|nr:probable ATP-dependent RNA helicase DDX56 isoform X2 [Manacus candei]